MCVNEVYFPDSINESCGHLRCQLNCKIWKIAIPISSQHSRGLLPQSNILEFDIPPELLLNTSLVPVPSSTVSLSKPGSEVITLALGVLLALSALVSAAWCYRFALADQHVRMRERVLLRLSKSLPSLPRYKRGYDLSLDETGHSESALNINSTSQFMVDPDLVSKSSERLMMDHKFSESVNNIVCNSNIISINNPLGVLHDPGEIQLGEMKV